MQFEIELFGHYYYRDEMHIPHRITIVGRKGQSGFYYYVEGHLAKAEALKQKENQKLIHVNKITIQ